MDRAALKRTDHHESRQYAPAGQSKLIYGVYKPAGPTSHDVVDEIRKITGEQRVGHAGTLDPLARGVLVVGVGREATKKLKEIVAAEKEYIAKIRLGVTSTTDDEEGEKREMEIQRPPAHEETEQALKNFEGRIQQVPPNFSAVKIKGREAYKLARRGENVSLKPRIVEIKSISLVEYQWPFVTLRVVTGPGVYIRSLARDLGTKLRTGGYLADLERIRVGQFRKEDALTLEEFKKA